ncbi:hypothetical protein AAJ76_1190005595 [Vairimorpha ceranae]|uniref:Uncharacterized protein n=1 Tax=Vairimorpha ceranae TaxID=40302 RepID=A0A0F9YMW9_9MICR|nr:hypothetical protein AAJ76_1190005595 [Vairimorpha ceranae]KKO74097.1 hypothetical protein AAJ76_1190005595 [Vairimorpha ceranae]
MNDKTILEEIIKINEIDVLALLCQLRIIAVASLAGFVCIIF